MAELDKSKLFLRDEEGSFTIEFVIWTPIFVIMMAIMMNVSMVFFHESQILRVVQDANRAYAQKRITSTEDNEAYILSKLSYLNATPTITSVETGGAIRTTFAVPVTDLMPFTLMEDAFTSKQIVVTSDQVLEF
ncbi:TadE/TadG family type IV pilus assembly protein [Alisedimentitalea sp. MJ-SS2]|uniref:TadE/TadG family type IV pilus assembly protein n=1 Tax=Aliisedimentitalea sp. MJ-SS2 TaxID=3049795 RepID=UPI0029141A37|nr:TadE/TadG family type IV pilus assembly protein [Alisedimentitalea sp. MJ-SS2]MDU8926836.1 TadE/TadG family type IV pilus assembly protein [Alisedimentitalea sp. MJ-SS2]